MKARCAGDLGPGRDEQVDERRRQRDQRRDLLQRPEQRQPRHEREPVAHDHEHRRRRSSSCAAPRSRRGGRASRSAAPSRPPDRSPSGRRSGSPPRRRRSGPGSAPGYAPTAPCARGRRASCGPDGVRPLGLEHRRARVADRAEPLEPGEPAEVEAAGLGGPARRRQPRLSDQPRARASAPPAGSMASSEMRTRAGVRRGSRPWITTSSSSTRGRFDAERVSPIEPALDRDGHLVGQHRRRDRDRAQRRRPRAPPPAAAASASATRSIGPARARPRSRAATSGAERGEHPARRLDRQREIERDAEAEQHRRPEREVRALGLDERGDPGGAHVPCSPVAKSLRPQP